MNWLHHHLPEVESTNDYAMAWIRQHALTSPMLVTADHQTHGRGQREKVWRSQHGKDLCMSLALPVMPHWEPAELNKKVAMVTRDIVMRQAPEGINQEDVLIKWPNDLLVLHRGRPHKICGMLLENTWRGNQWTHVVIGIGINVLSKNVGTMSMAMSLKEAWNVEIEPARLAGELTSNLVDSLQASTTSEGYDDHLFGLNESREFLVRGELKRGMLLSVNPLGQGEFLWGETRERLSSSEVEWTWD